MWKLTSKKDGRIYYLLPSKDKYVVGRSNADIILENDTSISRNHAILFPKENHIVAVDTGSKYGTFFNQNIDNVVPMVANTPIELKIGERIQFGRLSNEWVLSKLNICTLVSSLNLSQQEQVFNDLVELKGKILDEWDESCTHLTMNEITVTIKVLHALVANIPIVSVNYWKAYISELEKGRNPPDPVNYLPKVGESFLNKENKLFLINESRRSLFSGKVFYFMSKKHYDKYLPIITRSGGECKDLSQGVQKFLLVKKNAVVIQYIPSSFSQSSQTVDSLSEYIKRNGKRIVPDSEIALAIVYCSTKKYCNPEHKIVAELLPETPISFTGKDVIAPRSQMDEVLAKRTQSDKIIAHCTLNDSDNITKSLQIPETIPVQPSLQTRDIFGDEVVEFLRPQVPDSIEAIDGIKRKREPSLERSSKKPHLNSDQIQSESTSPLSVQRETERSVFIPETNPDKSVFIPETNPPLSKSIDAVEKQLSHIDLSGFLDKSMISQVEIKVEDEGMENKPPMAVYSSDDNSDHEIMVTWNNIQPRKSKQASILRNVTATNKRPGSQILNLRDRKRAKFDANQHGSSSVETIKKPSRPIVFETLLKPTNWLSTTMIKQEAVDVPLKTEDNLDTSKRDWIDSISDAFEVKKANLVMQSRDTTNESSKTKSCLNESSIRNFKAFVKKHNYQPQRDVIKTISVVVKGL